MTNEQAKKMLKAKLECLKRETQILIAIIVIVMNAHYAMNKAIWGNRKKQCEFEQWKRQQAESEVQDADSN